MQYSLLLDFYRLAKECRTMRRKPDLIWILVLVFTLGIVTTGYTQSYFDRSSGESVISFEKTAE